MGWQRDSFKIEWVELEKQKADTLLFDAAAVETVFENRF
jgi:hypothetical protein